MRVLALGLLLISANLSAQVYTYVDDEGNRVFTDKPRNSNAQRITLAPSNEMQRHTPTVKLSPPSTAVAPVTKRAVDYQVLRIVLPEPDATVRHGAGEMIVTLSSEPGLLDGHRYRLILNGKPVSEPSTSPVFVLNHIDRGTHQLAAEILDSAGLIVERTPAQPFHMHRMSLAQKRKVTPCQPDDYGVRLECPLKDKPKPPRDIPFVPFI